MKCVIHIGLEKTGTTAIQRFLSRNRTRLDQAGFLVGWPEELSNSRFLVAKFLDGPDDYWSVRKWATREEMRNEIAGEVRWFEEQIKTSPAHTVLISSEHFHSRLTSVASVRAFLWFLQELGLEIEILVFLRPQGSLLASLYSSAVRSGSTASFLKFKRKMEYNHAYFDYWRLTGLWCRNEFVRRAIVVPYKEAPSCASGSVSTFLKALGIELGSSTDQIVNGKLSRAQLSLIRLANLATGAASHQGHGPNRSKLWTEWRPHLVTAIEESKWVRLGGYISPSRNFTTRFQESNTLVSNEYGIPDSFWGI